MIMMVMMTTMVVMMMMMMMVMMTIPHLLQKLVLLIQRPEFPHVFRAPFTVILISIVNNPPPPSFCPP
jgi:hypothetical protein